MNEALIKGLEVIVALAICEGFIFITGAFMYSEDWREAEEYPKRMRARLLLAIGLFLMFNSVGCKSPGKAYSDRYQTRTEKEFEQERIRAGEHNGSIQFNYVCLKETQTKISNNCVLVHPNPMNPRYQMVRVNKECVKLIKETECEKVYYQLVISTWPNAGVDLAEPYGFKYHKIKLEPMDRDFWFDSMKEEAR